MRLAITNHPLRFQTPALKKGRVGVNSSTNATRLKRDFFNRFSEVVRLQMVKPWAPKDEANPDFLPIQTHTADTSMQVLFTARAAHPDLTKVFRASDPQVAVCQVVHDRLMACLDSVYEREKKLTAGPTFFNFGVFPEQIRFQSRRLRYGFWHVGMLFSWRKISALETQQFQKRIENFAKDVEPIWQYPPFLKIYFEQIQDMFFSSNQLTLHRFTHQVIEGDVGMWFAIMDLTAFRKNLGKKSRARNLPRRIMELAEWQFYHALQDWQVPSIRKQALSIKPGLILKTIPGEDPRFVRVGIMVYRGNPDHIERFGFLLESFQPK